MIHKQVDAVHGCDMVVAFCIREWNDVLDLWIHLEEVHQETGDDHHGSDNADTEQLYDFHG
jgi:hypothetical protein